MTLKQRKEDIKYPGYKRTAIMQTLRPESNRGLNTSTPLEGKYFLV